MCIILNLLIHSKYKYNYEYKYEYKYKYNYEYKYNYNYYTYSLITLLNYITLLPHITDCLYFTYIINSTKTLPIIKQVANL